MFVFWKNKKGYCEYFATLATLVLRNCGIPARYVTGFVRPERVSGRPYVLFRRHHSHSWVEALVDNRWIAFDPTPPIMVAQNAKSMWIQEKWEGLKGRMAYLIHLIRDGNWRLVVDGWQNIIGRFLTNFVFYGICFGVILVVLVFKYCHGVKIKKSESRQEILSWIHLLCKAERKAAHLGFSRFPGETVHAFVGRMENAMRKNDFLDEKKRKQLEEIISNLNEYENHRWNV